MILSFQVTNYRSYREPGTLHFTKGSFKKNRPANGQWDDVTYRVTGLFGANGAGKSNILNALMGLKYAVRHSLRGRDFTQSLQQDHFAGLEGEPTVFLIDYVANGIRYRWELELNDQGVTYEVLQASVEGPWRLVFERSGTSVKFGPSSNIPRAAQENIDQFLRPWVLTMSAWETVKTPGKYAPAFEWWHQTLLDVPHGEHEQRLRHEWILRLAKESIWLDLVRETAKAADIGITDVSLDEEEVPAEVMESFKRFISLMSGDESDNVGLSDESSDQLKPLTQYLTFTHKSPESSFTLSESQQSAGTRAWIDIALPALFAIIHGGVLVVDEIDGSLHSGLVREMIGYFNDPVMNTHGAQLVFSSHDLTLLGNHPEPALERESTWFAEKTAGVTELFSLDEFKLRSNHNVEKRYLQGAFGALPNPNKSPLRLLVNALQESVTSDQVVQQ